MSNPEFNMSENPYASFGTVAAEATETARGTFIRRTYAHLAGAIYALIGIEFFLFTIIPAQTLDGMVNWMLGSRINYLIFFGSFMLVSYVADKWARSDASPGMQYGGLSLYVVAQSLFLLPLLYIADRYTQPMPVMGYQVPVILAAAGITLFMFAGLTAIVMFTRQDFSFLGTGLKVASFAALGLIVCSVLFGFNLGVFFSFAMVVFACGYILYDTSNILHQYRTDQHVAASLALFASVILLFWYVLRILIALSGRR